MLFPKVTFKLNKRLDKKMALEFLAVKQGGIIFSRGIINIHPELKKVKEIKDQTKRQKIISKYFDDFYDMHNSYLNGWVNNANKIWHQVATKFFNETRKLFKGYHFPPGKYIGYISTINCNPRFIKNKTFQVFYLHPLGFKYVTAHELLHFIFYDYILKNYPKIFKNKDTEKGIFWDLAELFNSIILHAPPFISIHHVVKVINYPEHADYISKATKVWNKYRDIDKFVMVFYELLKKKYQY